MVELVGDVGALEMEAGDVGALKMEVVGDVGALIGELIVGAGPAPTGFLVLVVGCLVGCLLGYLVG